MLKKDCRVGNLFLTMPIESTWALSLFGMYWRDCVGIEPTEPDTQAPQGFEDPGGHQSPIQPPH